MMIIITKTIATISVITIKVMAATNTKTALAKITKAVQHHSHCHYHHKNNKYIEIKTASSRFYNFKLRHY